MSVGRDREAGQVELLAGREATTLSGWLTAHPGVQMVCRDRWGAYAEVHASAHPMPFRSPRR